MSPRRYDVSRRAEAAAATRERLVRATLELAELQQGIDMTLDQIAERAGTSVQTALRHFGSRRGLIDAAIERGMAEVAAERRAPGAGLEVQLSLLLDHYERRGAFVLRLLAREDAAAAAVTGPGKMLHREWVADVFQAELVERDDREDSLDLLAVATDVYTWKLLRLERGLSRDDTEDRIRELTRRILRA